jgi:hypothetical protein
VRLLAVPLEIVVTAEQADFLGPEPDDPEGAQRAPGIHDALGGRGGDSDARGIVDRAGALVPAVEVAADKDRREARVAARDLGDDVA